jgi:WD40 repeat protein
LDIETIVNVSGAANTVDWRIGPASTPMSTLRVGLKSRQVNSSAAPLTGWVSGAMWWPSYNGFELIVGAPPSAQISCATVSSAIAFVPDGRIAVDTPSAMQVVDPSSPAVVVHALARAGLFARDTVFSPDGLRCYVSDNDSYAVLIDTLGGDVKTLGRRISLGRPEFLNNDELILCDNGFLRHVDAVTGQTEFLGKSAKNFIALAVGGKRRAFTSSNSDQVKVIDADGAERCSFDRLYHQQQMSLSPDGHWLALKGVSGISLFDVETGKKIWEHEEDMELPDVGSRIKWSEDGLRGAVAENQFVYLWSLKAPRWVARVPSGKVGHFADLDVALSANGRRMAASAGGSNSVALWPDLDAVVRPGR